MRHFNLDFFRNIQLALRPNLWRPSFEVSSILELEGILPSHIEGLIFDVDQTVVSSDLVILDDRFKNALLSLRKKYKCCFLSNYRESRLGRLKDIENQTAIPVSIIAKRKPGLDAFNVAVNLLAIPRNRVAMVGDRVLTDVLGARNAGLTTVLVDPINAKADPYLSVKIPRFLERVVYRFIRRFFTNQSIRPGAL